MNSSKIDVLELGEKFTKTEEDGTVITKRSVYSVKGTGSLGDMLKKRKSLSQEQKNRMILDLLEGVKSIHDKGVVHQDIKADNILVKGNPKKGYQLKIADFGWATKEDDSVNNAVSSAGYQSPEIACYYDQAGTLHHDFFKIPKSHESVGYRSFANNQNKSEFQVPDAEKPNKANDMWALGIVCYEICYGNRPTTPEEIEKINDPLIKGLLNPTRAERLTADKAIVVALADILLQPTHTDKELKRVAHLLNDEEIFNEVKKN